MNTVNEIKTILFISDVADKFEDLDISRFDLEVTEKRVINEILDGIKNAGFNAVHLESPNQIVDEYNKYPNALVLSVWSGLNNRNRRALVPSICELHSIPYVGADAYAALLCSDKELSKTMCYEFKMQTPKGLLLRSKEQENNLFQRNFNKTI